MRKSHVTRNVKALDANADFATLRADIQALTTAIETHIPASLAFTLDGRDMNRAQLIDQYVVPVIELLCSAQ